VSDEPEALIEKVFIDQLGVKYPFVKAKGVNQLYAVAFFPSVYTVDAGGRFHAMPKDRMPAIGELETLLKDVALAPPMPGDSRFDAVRGMWAKKDHAKLGDYLTKMLAQEKLDTELREHFAAQQTTLEKRAKAQVASVERLGAGPDYLQATAQLEGIEKSWKGFPAADAARLELARLASDATVKKEIAASKALQKLRAGYDTGRLAQARKLAGELDKFVKQYPGTHAAKQAQAQRQELQAR
jgi:hypothetical protein